MTRAPKRRLRPDLARFAPLAFALLATTGCGNSGGPTAPRGPTDLPPRFALRGSAAGSDAAGRTADCRLDLIFEVSEFRRSASGVEYRGTHGGEVYRRVLDAAGDGFAFFADVFGEVEAELLYAGTVEIVIPVNLDGESRFWHNLGRFAGSVTPEGFGRGRWTCAPFDIDIGGYVDLDVVVTGDWTLSPLP